MIISPFKKTEREVYDKNTLVDVICQFDFPRILKIGIAPPADFQERIRGQYPHYKESPNSPSPPPELLQLLRDLGGTQSTGLALASRPKVHSFFSADLLDSVHLGDGFLSVSTEKYRCWEAFRESIELAESALRAEYSPALYSRVVLNYKNVIKRSDLPAVDRWDQYLNHEFLGELAAPQTGNHVVNSHNRTLYSLGDRALCGVEHGLQVADDETREASYVIDTEIFTTEDTIESSEAFVLLDQFHRISGDFFRWAASEKLRSALGARTL